MKNFFATLRLQKLGILRKFIPIAMSLGYGILYAIKFVLEQRKIRLALENSYSSFTNLNVCIIISFFYSVARWFRARTH